MPLIPWFAACFVVNQLFFVLFGPFGYLRPSLCADFNFVDADFPLQGLRHCEHTGSLIEA